MPKLVIATSKHEPPSKQNGGDHHMQVAVHIQADVLAPAVAQRSANVWLLENVGNLLGAENPELVIGEQLVWRCDVVLGVPDITTPGTGDRYDVGRIEVDAVTGDILNPEELAEALHVRSALIART